MTTSRLKWEGSWVNTWTKLKNGVELRVKFLPGSRTWGIYVDGELKWQQPNGLSGLGRATAKRKASRWFADAKPKSRVPCVHCGGTGWTKSAS